MGKSHPIEFALEKHCLNLATCHVHNHYTGKKVYLRCLENNIFTSVVLLYMYVYLPMDGFLDESLQLYNRSDKISDNNLMIIHNRMGLNSKLMKSFPRT